MVAVQFEQKVLLHNRLLKFTDPQELNDFCVDMVFSGLHDDVRFRLTWMCPKCKYYNEDKPVDDPMFCYGCHGSTPVKDII